MKHKRLWRTFHVDLNISCSWLERLNDLKAFNLISICEGHHLQIHPYDKQSHINLRLKPLYLAEAITEWQPCRDNIHSLVDQSPVSDDIYVHASLSLDYSFPDSAISREEFGVQFLSKHHRTQTSPEPWFEKWFQQTVELIESIDAQIVAIFK